VLAEHHSPGDGLDDHDQGPGIRRVLDGPLDAALDRDVLLRLVVKERKELKRTHTMSGKRCLRKGSRALVDSPPVSSGKVIKGAKGHIDDPIQPDWRKGDPHPKPSINAGDRRTWR